MYDALNEAKRNYYTYFQQTDDSNINHVNTIKDLVATIKHYGGSVCNDAGLIKHEENKDRHHRKVGLNDNDSYHDKNCISSRFL